MTSTPGKTEREQALALLPAIGEARERFIELVAEVRPELHHYCARMTGSAFDGEDIVQDAMAKAYFALGQMNEPPPLRPWLFRIAHNTAMDFLRRYDRKNVALVAEVPDRAEIEEASVDPVLVEAALTVFMDLPPAQRSALILKDVLGHSLEEVATTLGTSVGAVKSALSRARANVPTSAVATDPPVSAAEQESLRRYVDLFNAHDWDGLRALLGAEARLDLVSRMERRVAEASYFHHYADITRTEDLRAVVGWVDGVAAIAMFRPASSAVPAYFILVEWHGSEVARIRDFRYVPYIAESTRFKPR